MMSFQDQDQPPKREAHGESTTESSKRTCLGTIATAHGVRGLVKIRCDADNPALLNGTLYTSETGQDTLTLTMKNAMGKYWLAEVEGITDRDEAQALRGTKLWLDRSALPDIEDEDAFYIDELVGIDIVDKEGAKIGKVIAVENYGAGDLLEIKPRTGETFYLPFTKENVPELHLDECKAVAVIPDGSR